MISGDSAPPLRILRLCGAFPVDSWIIPKVTTQRGDAKEAQSFQQEMETKTYLEEINGR